MVILSIKPMISYNNKVLKKRFGLKITVTNNDKYFVKRILLKTVYVKLNCTNLLLTTTVVVNTTAIIGNLKNGLFFFKIILIILNFYYFPRTV